MVLAFKLGPIPIRVHASFVVLAVLLGMTLQRTAEGVALWSAALVLTVLAHELGRAAAARAFGVEAGVDLMAFARGDRRLARLAPFRRAIVSVIGPTVSLAIGGLAAAARHSIDPVHATLVAAVHHLAWASVAWGGLNLVPMLPFEGGHLLLSIADGITHGHGERPIRLGSAVLAIILAIAALAAHLAFPALLCGVIALQNARGLRVREEEQQEALARVHLQAAFDALERGDSSVGAVHCVSVLRLSADARHRKDAVRLLAYTYATTGAWRSLLQLLESGGAVALEGTELERYERAARELGRAEDARRLARLRQVGGVGTVLPRAR
jgi:Zn-dependent protease